MAPAHENGNGCQTNIEIALSEVDLFMVLHFSALSLRQVYEITTLPVVGNFFDWP